MKTIYECHRTLTHTEAQERKIGRLEAKYGMEVSHHNNDGEPVMVDRVKNIWVAVRRNGDHVPA
jgi:hypothetical protein